MFVSALDKVLYFDLEVHPFSFSSSYAVITFNQTEFLLNALSLVNWMTLFCHVKNLSPLI